MSSSMEAPDEARAELYAIMRRQGGFEEKAAAALELGEAYLGVDNAHLTRIDPRIDFWQAVASTDPPDGKFPAGAVLDLETTYCRRVVEKGSTVALSDAPEQGWADDPAFVEHGVHCYHGTPLTVDGEIWGTLCFVSSAPRAEPFSESETLFAELLARLLEHELSLARHRDETNLQSNLISVLSRVLRHNLRNDLNVIRGHLSRLTEVSDGLSMSSEGALQKIDKLVELANTAREIESIATSDIDRQPVELTTLVEHIVNEVRRQHPDVTLSLEEPEEVYLEAVPTLRSALYEVVVNAAKHAGEHPTVTVTIEASEDDATVRIADNGPGLPEQERVVLSEGSESPLVHGSGLGLWLTYWIVSNHDGEIDTEVTDEGTTVSITIPRTSSFSTFPDSERLLARFHREQDRFEAVFEESFDAIVILDDEGRFTDVNPAAAELLGVDQSALRGRSIEDFLGDDVDAAGFWQATDGREPSTAVLTTQDGGERVVEYTAAMDIVPGQHMAILRDITERIERERALSETTQRLNLALDATNTGIFEWEVGTDTVHWSPELERLVGLDPGEFEGTYEAFADRVHDDDLPAIEERIQAAVEDGEQYRIEFRFRHEAGHYIQAEAYGQLIETDDGPEVVGVTRDVSGRSGEESSER